MPLLSRKVDYALLILSYLHHRPEGGSAREIAARFELGRPFVANILKLLCHNGFVTSHRGVKGGYVLRRPAQEIRLSDLMDALDDTLYLAQCNMAEPVLCGLTHLCPVRGAVAEVHRRLREVLADVMLGDLFGPVETGGGMHLDLLTQPLEGQLAAP
jgi:Rrf2 family protein